MPHKSIRTNKKIFLKKIILQILFAGFYLFVVVSQAQQRDSLFTNSLFYNSFYDDGSFIDSAYVAGLFRQADDATGEKRIGLLHKLLNGYYFSNPELSRELAQTALDYMVFENNDSLTAFSLHYLGLAYIYLDQNRLAIDTYSKALNTDYAHRKKDFRSWVSMNMANSYLALGEYDKAAEFYYRAQKLNESVGNKAFEAKIYDNLGALFLESGHFDEGLKNYNLALSLLDKEKDKRIISGVYTKLAVIEINRDNVDSSKIFFNLALSNAFALNDSSKITEIYSEYGNILFDHEMYYDALNSFLSGLRYCNPALFPIDYYTFLHGIGKSYLYLDDISIAKNFLLKAYSGLKNNMVIKELYELETSLSKLYAKTGEWKKFNYHLKKSEEYKSAGLEAKELATINELNILHETEKKDQQLAAQKLRIAEQEKELLLIIFIALALLAGLLVTLFLRNKLKIANRILYEKNLDITKRWNQLQHFYLIRKESQEKEEDVSLFTKINCTMTDDKIYTNPELTIDQLAKKVNSNTKYVSQAINENAEMNFSTYINTFRIEEAKQLLRDGESKNWSMDAVAEKCGFNNPTSFYQAFKKNTGMTPSAFKNINIDAA